MAFVLISEWDLLLVLDYVPATPFAVEESAIVSALLATVRFFAIITPLAKQSLNTRLLPEFIANHL
jgi:ABC-type maltose transport system permease subunit